MNQHITVQPLVYNGEVIHERNEMLSLTDMWRAAGAPANREPFNWARKEGAAFLDALSIAHNLPASQVMISKRGKGGGTFAHWQGGLAYAQYLNPDFHRWCNDVVRQRMEGRQVPAHVVLDESMKSAIGGIVKSCTGVVVREALEVILPRLIEADPRAAATEYKPALDVLIEKNVPAKRRRAFSQKVSSRLRRYSARHGHATRISRETGRYLFHVDAIGSWMLEEGQSLIASHVAALAGQGVLEFKRGR